ncbi:glycosyltransferase family 2 protein [Acidipropionibacterium virtanenii]|uniref:glycosyltransferase family 2 protein n=1 Tax=Acidipropionibacterium virtanenii TaxID=2057246 RepID=UPI0015EFF669|nr:glycosyltransferase family A protein [Acidipropionibacterium virtanenii]
MVIPTLGRSPHYRRLFESLSEQTIAPDHVVVVVQGDHDAVERSAAGTPDLPIEIVHHSPGLSASRNYGIECCGTHWRGVLIPDDDLWLADTTIEHAATLANAPSERIMVYAGRVSRPASSRDRVQYLNEAQELDRRTVWKSALEGGLLISREAFMATGGFDEALGLGSPGPYQSGEGTDLLLRVMDAGGSVEFEPQLQFYEDEPGLPRSEMLTKVRSYARGTGRVYRMRYGAAGRSGLVLRTVAKLTLCLARRDGLGVARSWNELLGRVEGLTGWVASPKTGRTA